MNDFATKPKLNVFALPSQTMILFVIIVGTLLFSLGVGSLGVKPIPIWPLAIGVVFVSLWGFLSYLEQEIARQHLTPVGVGFPKLQQAIQSGAQALNLRIVPRLLVSERKPRLGLYTFGTYQHWYIAVGHKPAQMLEEKLGDAVIAPVAEAQILHELSHFKNGDYWQVGYVTQLLRTVYGFLLWALFFFLGWGLLLVVATSTFVNLDSAALLNSIQTLPPDVHALIQPVFPSEADIADIRDKVAEINLPLVLSFIMSALWPFVLLSAILQFFYYPKLWRMREFYADAGAVHQQKDMLPLVAALRKISLPVLRKNLAEPSLLPRFIRTRSWFQGLKLKFSEVRQYHPSDAQREQGLRSPEMIFDSWFITAILIGGLTLVLDILLASPLSLLVMGDNPMHFATLTIFTVAALSLLPSLVMGYSIRRDIFKIVAFTIGLRFVWILLTIGLLVVLLFFNSAGLDSFLRVAVAVVAGYTGFKDTGFDDLEKFVMQASIVNLLQVVFIALILWMALWVTERMLRRLLTWYRLPKPEAHLIKRWAVGLIAWGVVVLAFLVLPIVTTLLLRPSDLLNPIFLVSIIGGGITLLIGIRMYWRADKQYAQICPHCQHAILGDYYLGRTCPQCQTILHPWLMVEYST